MNFRMNTIKLDLGHVHLHWIPKIVFALCSLLCPSQGYAQAAP